MRKLGLSIGAAVAILAATVVPVLAQTDAKEVMKADTEMVMEDSEGMSVDAMIARMTGPLVGGVMAHTWIDVLAVVVSFLLVLKLRGGRMVGPFALIGAAELAVVFLMFSGQPMWMASTVRSALILTVTLWLWRIFKV